MKIKTLLDAILAVSKTDFELDREGVVNWLLSITD